MKRFLILCITATLFGTSAYGWGRREHAVVAKVAENHLTPKAKEHLYNYMHRRSLVYYSCYADDYQPLYIDLGWQPSNHNRMAMFPHTFCVDENCKPPHHIKDGDEYVKNCLYFVDTWAKELKAKHKKMNDSVRMTHIALIVHALGDMHCPVHIRYPHDNTLGTYKVYFGKKKKDYHRFWDAEFVSANYSIRSYNDFAGFIDICNEKEIADICKGDVYDWGEEVARISLPIRAYEPDEVLNLLKFKRAHLDTGEELLRKAGYRLAKVLNEIFE